jgi:hypothetical protein
MLILSINISRYEKNTEFPLTTIPKVVKIKMKIDKKRNNIISNKKIDFDSCILGKEA